MRKTQVDFINVPKHLLFEDTVMVDPVILQDGTTCERSALLNAGWLVSGSWTTGKPIFHPT